MGSSHYLARGAHFGAQNSVGAVKAVKGKEYAKFAQKIDYTWFELWHHEGRIVRHAASMQGADYT